MSHSLFNAPVVAYASLCSNKNKCLSLESLHEFSRDYGLEMDIFAEEISPDKSHRPLWQNVLNLINEQKISMLVVPDLFQIAGDDTEKLASVVSLLKAKGIRLHVLCDGGANDSDNAKEVI